MAFLLLANTVGQSHNGIFTEGATVSAGYKASSAMAGARSRVVRADTDTYHTFTYGCPSTQVTHFVLAEAWYFKNARYSTSIDLLHAGGSASTTTVSAMELVGRNDRDWVKTIAQTSTTFSAKFNHSSPSATLYSKCYFSNAFDFGDPPQLVSLRDEDGRFKSWLGYNWYQTEAVIKLAWRNVTAAKVQEFDSMPICWPFFLYDENGDIFDHKLEHVVITEPFTKTRRVDGSYDIELTVRRLEGFK